jgi:hypothetical protein
MSQASRAVPPDPDLLTLPDAARLVLRLAPSVPLFSFWRPYWRRRHEVPSVRVGHALFFPKGELTRWARRFHHARQQPPAGVRRRSRRAARPASHA